MSALVRTSSTRGWPQYRPGFGIRAPTSEAHPWRRFARRGTESAGWEAVARYGPRSRGGRDSSGGFLPGSWTTIKVVSPGVDNFLHMIAARGLTKRFGDVLAVDDLTFDVLPGRVTGFLGPNGSGKSTTMAMIMGLDHSTSGSVKVLGKSYHELKWPLREVGASLEARAIHPGRSARAHLWSLAQYNSIPKRRVDEVLERVGLSDVANKRVGKFSLGMGQRLGIAAALLGDPAVVLLDEPVNGLDPEGIRWTRTLCRD